MAANLLTAIIIVVGAIFCFRNFDDRNSVRTANSSLADCFPALAAMSNPKRSVMGLGSLLWICSVYFALINLSAATNVQDVTGTQDMMASQDATVVDGITDTEDTVSVVVTVISPHTEHRPSTVYQTHTVVSVSLAPETTTATETETETETEHHLHPTTVVSLAPTTTTATATETETETEHHLHPTTVVSLTPYTTTEILVSISAVPATDTTTQHRTRDDAPTEGPRICPPSNDPIAEYCGKNQTCLTDELLLLPMANFQNYRRNPCLLPEIAAEFWHSNGCSHVPDKIASWDFSPACQRHDFGYRRYTAECRLDARGKRFVDAVFDIDMGWMCDNTYASGLEPEDGLPDAHVLPSPWIHPKDRNPRMRLENAVWRFIPLELRQNEVKLLMCEYFAHYYHMGVIIFGRVNNPECRPAHAGEKARLYRREEL
ncbi:hypothetical protein K490DRAFT_69071 [Saccharata proteae CBS 121410]|uniref:Uncharacterized protein n=1 Tax=Saccharata proteae CBS 121410 TaxID=1314787 RepID=A0A9P4LWL8_9PEZI|nr:hypothetical protein K490DRAFT_69071 [Saccharata proteae CBS 121410]